MNRLVSITDAAEALGVSRRTVLRMIHAEQLTPVNIRPANQRPTWRIPAEQVTALAGVPHQRTEAS